MRTAAVTVMVTIVLLLVVKYHRMGFNCESQIIQNCKFISLLKFFNTEVVAHPVLIQNATFKTAITLINYQT